MSSTRAFASSSMDVVSRRRDARRVVVGKSAPRRLRFTTKRRAVEDPRAREAVDASLDDEKDDAMNAAFAETPVARSKIVRGAVAAGGVVVVAGGFARGHLFTANESLPFGTTIDAKTRDGRGDERDVIGALQSWRVRVGATTGLEVREDGKLTLTRKSEKATKQTTQTLSIPLGKDGADRVVVFRAETTGMSAFDDGDDVLESLSVVWSDGTVLRASPTASADGASDAWCAGLEDGVLIEVSVPMATSNAAEVMVQLCDRSVDEEAQHWYGGSHLLKQLWPLERAKIETGPFYPFDHGPNGVGNVLGTHWVSSGGALVFVDPDSDALHMGLNAPVEVPRGQAPRYFGVGIQNASRPSLPLEEAQTTELGDGVLRLQSRASYRDANILHPWQDIAFDDNRTRLSLKVALAMRDDARSATRAALERLPKPAAAPNKSLMYYPIWTTWATSHADVTQESTVTVAKQILNAKSESGLPNGSIIEIDDRWQSRYGELNFDPVKFPDPKAMVKELHDMGFLVTVWVMPFLQESSAACQEAKRLGYLVEGGQPPNEFSEVLTGGFGQILGTTVKVFVDRFDWPPGHWEGGGGGGNLEPGQFRWWGTQPVRAIDFTNDDACEWFVKRLKKLQEEVGLDGFKFDAGEPCFLPFGARTRVPLKRPQDYSQAYVTKVCSRFPLSEVRVGMGTNAYNGLVRMGDKDTVWGVDNGLQSLVPTLLTSAVLGYPFTLPDIIGGNAYWNQTPDTELMTRWAQASAFMPAVQWSIPPWDVSNSAYAACVKVIRMREKLLLPRLPALLERAKDSLEPICRPMWWLSPDDSETFAIDDQFMVGDDMIVAPVVQKGALSRTVYLPSGSWREYESNAVISGGQRVTVDAPLDKLPVFIRA
jgi:hypothetical protein